MGLAHATAGDDAGVPGGMVMTRHTLFLTVTVTALAGLLGWAGHIAACLYSPLVPLCGHPYGPYIVPLLAMLLVIGSVMRALHRRLLRRLTRGMYAKPVMFQRGAAIFSSAVKMVWEGGRPTDDPTWHPLTHVPAGHGWRVAMDDGSEVIVLWDAMFTWVQLCWDFQHNPANVRQGATSHRVWDRQIGRSQVQARNHLLQISGSLRRNKTSRNSLRRLEGTPWTIMQKLYDAWPPDVV